MIARYHPDAAELFTTRSWRLPTVIDRVYDASRAEHRLGCRARTDLTAVLGALRRGAPSPVAHDSAYLSPKEH